MISGATKERFEQGRPGVQLQNYIDETIQGHSIIRNFTGMICGIVGFPLLSKATAARRRYDHREKVSPSELIPNMAAGRALKKLNGTVASVKKTNVFGGLVELA